MPQYDPPEADKSAGPTPVKQQQQRFHWAGEVNKGAKIRIVSHRVTGDTEKEGIVVGGRRAGFGKEK